MKILIMGDIHGSWGFLNAIIRIERPDIILQCGDFGFFPNDIKYNPKNIKTKETKIYWCDGNHEDFSVINDLINGITYNEFGEKQQIKNFERPNEIEVAPNIFYKPRGSTLTLPDGRTILFMGGAHSIDKPFRTPGLDWFPDETIKESDINFLPDFNIDIVISHTCPKIFVLPVNNASFENHGFDLSKDISQEILTHVYEKYKPKKWFFGHWHLKYSGVFDNCEWYALNIAAANGGIIKLNEITEEHVYEFK